MRAGRREDPPAREPEPPWQDREKENSEGPAQESPNVNPAADDLDQQE
jgi:hypothetical protein